MPTIDNFTDTNGTALYTHNSNLADAGGATTEPEIQNNACQAVNTFETVQFRDTTSTSDDHQIVLVAGAALIEERWVCNRSSSTAQGYQGQLVSISGTDYTRVDISKNGSFLALQSGLTIDGSVDITVRVTTADSGANVDIEVFTGGVSRITYTDTTSVISSGNPGARLYSGATKTNAVYDTWFDNEAAAGGTPKNRAINGPFAGPFNGPF